MDNRNTVLATGLVLWVLGILVGAGAAEVIPGQFTASAKVVLGVALLASIGNFIVLSRKIR